MKHFPQFSFSLFLTFLVFIAFFRLTIAQVPSGITTTTPTLFTSTSCTTGGNVTTGVGITAKGVVYAKTSNPTTANSVTNDGTGTGSFTSQITGLDSGSVYYLRAYATNATGTAYGNQIQFHTSAPVNVLTRGATAITKRSVYVVHDAGTQGNMSPSNTARGIIFATHNTPTFSDSVRALSSGDVGNGRGDRFQLIADLLPGTTYYVRSYATNPAGTTLSSVISFTTAVSEPTSGGCPSPTDIDGNVYTAVKIGNSCWLQTNLKTTRYRNGDSVRYLTSNLEWASTMLSLPHVGAWCYYQNDSSNNSVRGKLYNWMAFTDARGLCPTGWSSPTAGDFDALVSNVTQIGYPAISLKAESYGYISNNSSGFSAVPAFRRRENGAFEGSNDPAHFWTTESNGTTQARARELAIHRTDLQNLFKDRKHGYSVRCIRNATISISTLPGNVLGSNEISTGGSVSSTAGDSVFLRGVAYSTHRDPTTSGQTVTSGSGQGSFTVNLTGLSSGTTYFFRSFAVVEAGTSYGNIDSLTLIPSQVVATISTNTASIISDSSVLLGGEITFDGGATVTQRGIAYSTTSNPDISSNITIDGSGTGAFTASISGLSPATTYYARAYAINSVGTAYGQQVNFTTRVRVTGGLVYANSSSTAFTNSSISLLTLGSITATALTQNNSQFSFLPVEIGSYGLSVSTSKPWGGVNATDAILIINHFSNGIPLQGVRLAAADVDANAHVNATDALQTMQRSVGIRTLFDAGNFVWSPSSLNMPSGSGNIVLPVSVLAMGDVNASYLPSLQLREQWMDFSSDETLSGVSGLSKGLLPLAVNLPVLPAAVSLSIELPKGAQLEGVEVPGLQTQLPVVFHQEGQMARIAWCNPSAALLPSGTALCGLKISGCDPDVMRWGNESEIANAQGVAYEGLIWRKPNTISSRLAFDTRLFPNPSSGQCSLEWSLSQPAGLDFQIYNTHGSLVWQHSQIAVGGRQRMFLPTEWPAGIYTIRARAVLANGDVIVRSIKMIQN
jgi:uncharacterized protein (TIGR02145 family)